MCLIEAFTRCGAFPVHPFTFSFFPQVKKEVFVRACSRRCVKAALLRTLGLVLCCAFAIDLSSSLLQVTKEEMHDTQDALIA